MKNTILCAAGWLLLAAAGTAGSGVPIQTEEFILLDPGPAACPRFGGRLSVCGDTALVASVGINNCAIVFVREGSVWTPQAWLSGTSVTLEGVAAVIGNPNGGVEGVFGAGLAEVSTRTGPDWSCRQVIHASDFAMDDSFGYSVALSGNLLLVGAPHDDDAGSDSGSAYVFRRTGFEWIEVAKLTAADAEAGDVFGQQVDIDDDTALIGAELENGAQGAAYVFVLSGTTWSQEAKLTASDGAADARFGRVAIHGDTAVIGAPLHDSAAADAGSAYVFVRTGTLWSEQQKLLASDGAASDEFGGSVSVSGDRIVVGALRADGGGADSGAAYAYSWSGSAWILDAKLVGSDGLGFSDISTVLDGSTALLGTAAGRVYVYSLGPPLSYCDASGDYLPLPMTETLDLVDPNIDWGDQFGSALSIRADTLVVGASGDETIVQPGYGPGMVYVFLRSGASWGLQDRFKGPDSADDDAFGAAVELDGDTLVVGAPYDNTAVGGSNAGSAYVFVRGGSTWGFVQKLTANDPGAQDLYGTSVTVQGDTILIGAPGEDEAGTAAGAVYVLRYDGTSWLQTQKLTVGGQYFGRDVDLEGDTALVAGREAYVFVRDGVNWLLQTVFDIPGNHVVDSVALAQGTAVVGGRADSARIVRIYVGSGSSWNLQAEFGTPGGSCLPHDNFGVRASLDGDRLLVGADDGVPFPGSGGRGAAYVFSRAGTRWSFEARLEASDAHGGTAYGSAVALEGTTALVGARYQNVVAYSAGATYVFELPPSFPSFCSVFDDALASCPCWNVGALDGGCDLAQGTGGVRFAILGQETAPTNRITATGTGFPPGGSPAAVAIRAASLDAAAPISFGDGVRCVGTPLTRLGAASAVNGFSTHTFGHSAMAGNGTFYYQLWFRNQPPMFCTPEAFNLSSGRAISW